MPALMNSMSVRPTLKDAKPNTTPASPFSMTLFPGLRTWSATRSPVRRPAVQTRKKNKNAKLTVPLLERHVLSCKHAQEPTRKSQEPDEPATIGDQGALPSELAIPAGSANYPTLGEPPRPQVSQPISVSLNTEDDDDGP